jgi:hypothetical protein
MLTLVWGSVPPSLHSNAAPHQTPYFMFELAIFTSAINTAIAETQRTPPNEAANVAVTVTLSPKSVGFLTSVAKNGQW